MAFKVKFWGVRGSIACPSPRHIRYGGNTSCVEIHAGDRRFILDAGTGIRTLGHEFIRDGIDHIDLLLTHTHWDHINGFPFFVPAYNPKWSLHIRAGHLSGKDSIRDVLSSQMDNPMFPVPLDAMRANMVFEDFRAGESFNLDPKTHVRTAPLNHPNGATAYRIEYGGHAICYVTDTEHVDGELDQKILALIDGADVMIYDATYTEAEMPMRKGWGHSTWNEGVKLCREAGVKKLVIFHHEPDHDDEFMDQLVIEARKEWPDTVAASESSEIVVIE